MSKKTRIGIIFGGDSVEHEISILSCIQALYAIDYNKYNVTLIYLTKKGEFLVGPNFDKLETFKSKYFKSYKVILYSDNNKLYLKGKEGHLPRKYREEISVVMPIVHGKGLEDGSLAGFLNILKVPYTSSNVLPSSIMQDKSMAKKILSREMIPVIKGVTFFSTDWQNDVFKVLEKLKKIPYPVIIKPVSLGSSIGIYTAENDEDLLKAINQVIKYDDKILVEKKIKNFREFNQAVLGMMGEYQESDIEEVVSQNNYLTFNDKYKNELSKRIIPADIEEEVASAIKTITLKIANLFNIKGVIRIDYLYDIDAKKLYVNEINSIPGSLAYYLFEGKKIYFSKLIDKLISYAIREKYYADFKISSFQSNILDSKKILKK